MGGRRVPFKTRWADSDEQAIRWFDELERLGPENVRTRVAQHDGGSAGAIRGLGVELAITKGFAEEWLNYRDRKSRWLDTSRWWAIFAVTGIGAVAAVIAAVPIVRSWLQ